jgi:hypothetical protein
MRDLYSRILSLSIYVISGLLMAFLMIPKTKVMASCSLIPQFAARGWKLFPMAAATKMPIVKWGTTEPASSDIEQLTRWAMKYPGCNWGCATGSASGFFVVDPDDIEGWMWTMGKGLPTVPGQMSRRGGHRPTEGLCHQRSEAFSVGARGKLRIHKKPSMKEIHGCRPRLEAELEAVRPELIVYPGATAAQSLPGSGFKITQSHGKMQQAEGFPPIIATLHPSAILRARTDEDREQDTKIFMDDLARVTDFLKK